MIGETFREVRLKALAVCKANLRFARRRHILFL
jgi:hypothetical protein